MTTKRYLMSFFVSVIVIIGIYFIVIKPFILDPFNLKRNHKYTIGIVEKKEAPVNGDIDAVIFYNVNGKRFDAIIGVGNFDHSVNIGNRYFVEFYVKNPNIGKVITDIPVLDTLKDIPPGGWDILP